MRDWDQFNRGVIEEFRGTGGKTAGRFTGRPLLLLTTTGAKTGRPRTVPLVYSRDGDRLVVIASKGGEPTNPDWYHNLLANPTVTVELPGETFRAAATVADGAERRRLFDQQAALMPFFAEYERTTARQIPVVILERLDRSAELTQPEERSPVERQQAMPDTTPTKDDLLAALAAERRFWDALVATVTRGNLMERPGIGDAAATFKDVAAHLNDWRELTLARLEAASHGSGPPGHPWPSGLDDDTPAGTDAINAWFAARARDRSVADVLAETAAQFDTLAAAVAAIPAADLLTPGRFASIADWLADLPIGPALLGFSFTHLHTDHEPDIRAWLRRETGTEPVLPPPPPDFGYVE
jgi:deazaflavin-dependent oxidoreductase (nitroreductase family)